MAGRRLGALEGGGWAPRTRKRHQQEHRPQRPTERSAATQHAKGRTGDCPGSRKGTTTRRTVPRGLPPPHFQCVPAPPPPPSPVASQVLPVLHIWLREEPRPTGLTYALKHRPWSADGALRLVNSGSAVVLGVTLAGEVYYLDITNPKVPPLEGTAEVRAAVRPSLAAHDVSGVLFTEAQLRQEFERFPKVPHPP